MNIRIYCTAFLLIAHLSEASTLIKKIRFEALHSISEISNNDEVWLKDESTLPISEELILPELNSRELITKVYGFSSIEKYKATRVYLMNHSISFTKFLNLFDGLKVAGLRPIHQNPLLGFFVSNNKNSLKEDEFFALMERFTSKSYLATTKSNNWPLQVAHHYLNGSSLSLGSFLKIGKQLKEAGMNYRFIDEDLAQAYVKKNAKKLSVDDLKKIMGILSSDYESVQRAGILFSNYLQQNIKKLLQSDFCKQIEDLKKTIPFDMQIMRVGNMPVDARKNLFYIEYELFQSLWSRDLFFTIDKAINLIHQNVPSRDHKRLVKTFLERNKHRLSDEDSSRFISEFMD